MSEWDTFVKWMFIVLIFSLLIGCTLFVSGLFGLGSNLPSSEALGATILLGSGLVSVAISAGLMGIIYILLNK